MNTFVFFFSLFLFLSLLSFHCAAQVFAACFSAPVHQLYGYTVTTPELRRSSCDWVVDSCIVVVPDCTVDAMPFRWNWTLSAIQQCQTFLSWRNLPAAEQREKMVSPLLCIFWQDCTPRGLSILPLSSDECGMFKRRFLKEQYLDTSSGRPAFCCALLHWPKPMLIVWSCLWYLRFGFPFFVHVFARTRLSSLVPRDLFMRSMYVAVAYTMYQTQ